jgi:hypothetical protein
MTEDKCPFSTVQAAGLCACEQAREVVRRGGSEFDCESPPSCDTCRSLVTYLYAVGLPTLGFEDDLTTTPKSAYDRVLVGGLQGLRQLLDPTDRDWQTPNIWPVVAAVHERFGSTDAIPPESVLPAIEACSLRRRRTKRP